MCISALECQLIVLVRYPRFPFALVRVLSQPECSLNLEARVQGLSCDFENPYGGGDFVAMDVH